MTIEIKNNVQINICLANTKFYACVVTRKDYLERIEGGGYDQEEYDQYPSRYKSTFNKKVWCSLVLLERI